MTTGELLVQMSTLSTGTALEHFTNISFGGGGDCPDPVPCPECPDITDCPECEECEDCQEEVGKIPVTKPGLPSGVWYPDIHEGPVLVIEEMNIAVDVMDNQIEFGITIVDEEMDIILNIEPNTVKIDLEWL